MPTQTNQWSYDELDGDSPESPSMLPTLPPLSLDNPVVNQHPEEPKTPPPFANFPGAFPPPPTQDPYTFDPSAWSYDELEEMDEEVRRVEEGNGGNINYIPDSESPKTPVPPPRIPRTYQPPPLNIPPPPRRQPPSLDRSYLGAPLPEHNDLGVIWNTIPSLDLSVGREHGVTDEKTRSSSVNIPPTRLEFPSPEEFNPRNEAPPLPPDDSSSIGGESVVTNREDDVMRTSLEGHRYLSIPDVFRVVTLGGNLSIKNRMDLGTHIAMKFKDSHFRGKVTIRSAWNPVVGSSPEIKIRWYNWCEYQQVAIGCLEWFGMNMDKVVY